MLHDFWHHQLPRALVQFSSSLCLLSTFLLIIIWTCLAPVPAWEGRERQMGVYHHLDTIEQQISLKINVLNIIIWMEVRIFVNYLTLGERISVNIVVDIFTNC